ncbi:MULTISPECIES: hypothetical protein [unclassified Arthrobacter]|uniref:hypothetical protein n=1 Tax=unclassified Arthrobacter TaxID=235627 RepID=UPI002104C166|nr:MULTISPECIES: hypothetical protein [unclassified Arthrobacter]MCQ1947703.1 hypothetical protein [Arthrobacter sp. zg-Y1116]MCQ1987646.1 hypothetical protein [Arthrobacter sp. zg-Y844]MCQ1996393.1 hypothetical protein [Arthrobacter sp. zg-Y1171]UWX82566.1 hypothetical protein N2L00_03810 [Arthrobacter sp. zg-Y1171]
MARNITARNTGLLAAALLLTSISSCAAPPQEDPTSSAPQWSTYTTADSSLRFEHPAGWDIRELPARANDPAGGVSLEVLDDGGRVLARLDTGIITDLSCTEPAEPASYVEYESVPMPKLESKQGSDQRFVYRSLAPSGPRNAQATYAVVSGQQQSPECGLFDFFRLTESSGGRFAGEYGDGSGDAQDTDTYLDGAERYRETQEYSDIKEMLTSLRNAD